MSSEEDQERASAVREARAHRRSEAASTLAPGFTFRPVGRSGFIYFRSGERVLEVYVEMAGVAPYDMLVWPEGLENWIYPERLPLSSGELQSVRREFGAWLKQQNFTPDYP